MAASSLEKQVMVVAIDESEHRAYALKWTLDHFFTPIPNPLFKLVLVHAKPSAISTLGIAGPGIAEVLPIVELDLKRKAAKVVEKAKEIYPKKSVSEVEVGVIGEARNVIGEAGEKQHASLLVVGSHGYGAIKRLLIAFFVAK